MALVHVKKEKGKYVARGYGDKYVANNPIEAFIGLKLFRAYRLGLICTSKYPFLKIEWITLKASDLSKKYSQSFIQAE
ncbi:hypothetical protein [Enterobacter asburiae]|uniref:hypothetical protein n=1 Tax=Enterobacter asburiae TaxID=61645 RepID=UPI0021CF551F|nr:hypothetical protein [Enterobacter asburiae]MCU6243325.1 hypothetical protein [Enterobacter asburiae]